MEQEKSYEVFNKALAAALELAMEDHFGLHVSAEPTTAIKTNVERQGISVHFEDSNVSPTFYTEDLFRQYQEGVELSGMVERLEKTIYQAHMEGPQQPNLTLEEARRHVRLAVVNTERNAELLKNTPHFEMGDLSAIPKWYISDEACFVVKNNITAQLGMTPDEMLQLARENTISQEFSVMKMTDMMRDMMIKDGMDPELADSLIPEGELPMLIITTPNKLDGAACILNESVLEEARQRIGSDSAIVLPSSRHEVTGGILREWRKVKNHLFLWRWDGD